MRDQKRLETLAVHDVFDCAFKDIARVVVTPEVDFDRFVLPVERERLFDLGHRADQVLAVVHNEDGVELAEASDLHRQELVRFDLHRTAEPFAHTVVMVIDFTFDLEERQNALFFFFGGKVRFFDSLDVFEDDLFQQSGVREDQVRLRDTGLDKDILDFFDIVFAQSDRKSELIELGGERLPFLFLLHVMHEDSDEDGNSQHENENNDERDNRHVSPRLEFYFFTVFPPNLVV